MVWEPFVHDHDQHADIGDGADKPSALAIELREHVPFSVSAVAIGLIVAGAICIVGFGDEQERANGASIEPAIQFFHLFHPAHMLFSAAATTAMFRRYDRKIGKAVIIGLVGAIGVCGVSDIVLPHVSLMLMGTGNLHWHICIVEHPSLVLPFAGVGVLMGIGASAGVTRSTLISHSLHVLASTMASIFYLVGPLGLVAWIDDLGQVFLAVVIAVMVPCCLSDIVFPVLMSRDSREIYKNEPHAH